MRRIGLNREENRNSRSRGGREIVLGIQMARCRSIYRGLTKERLRCRGDDVLLGRNIGSRFWHDGGLQRTYQYTTVTPAVKQQEHDLILIQLFVECLGIDILDARCNRFANPRRHGGRSLPPCIVYLLPIEIAVRNMIQERKSQIWRRLPNSQNDGGIALHPSVPAHWAMRITVHLSHVNNPF